MCIRDSERNPSKDVLSPAFETTTLVVLGVILLLDLLYVARRPHEPSM